eukprot:906985-Lingulodinium_polyedra.AAC.1
MGALHPSAMCWRRVSFAYAFLPAGVNIGMDALCTMHVLRACKRIMHALCACMHVDTASTTCASA